MKNICIILIALFLLSSCAKKEEDSQLPEIQSLVKSIKQAYAPDGRIALFDVAAEEQAGNIVVMGETNLSAAAQALKDSLVANSIAYIDSLRILPDVAFGDTLWAVVNNSVSNLRSQPKHSAELATQALLGMPLKLLKRQGDWYLVQTPDEYIAWMDYGGMVRMTEAQYQAWKSKEKVIFTEVFGHAFGQMDKRTIVSDLVMGDVLVLISESNGYRLVEYPDGRKAIVPNKQTSKYSEWLNSISLTSTNLLNTAVMFTGTPYLWGGTSAKGMDCSGFTKTVYMMNGLVIPRDASQQVHEGELVDTAKDWSVLEPGDLLFFGRAKTDSTPERVVHVGLWVGDGQFVHASGDGQVRYSSVVPETANYDKLNHGRYLRSKRYIEATSKHLKSIEALDLY